MYCWQILEMNVLLKLNIEILGATFLRNKREEMKLTQQNSYLGYHNDNRTTAFPL